MKECLGQVGQACGRGVSLIALVEMGRCFGWYHSLGWERRKHAYSHCSWFLIMDVVGPISSSSSHCGFPAVMVQKLELQVTINKTVITATGKEANTMIPLTSQHAAWLILTNGYKCNGQTVAAVLCYFQLLPTAPTTVAKTNQPKPQSPEDKTSFHH